MARMFMYKISGLNIFVGAYIWKFTELQMSFRYNLQI